MENRHWGTSAPALRLSPGEAAPQLARGKVQPRLNGLRVAAKQQTSKKQEALEQPLPKNGHAIKITQKNTEESINGRETKSPHKPT